MEAGWTSRGTRRRISRIGKTKRDALAALKEAEREIARNGIPQEGAKRASSLKVWCEDWLTIDATRSEPTSHTANRSAVNKWIIPTLGHIKIEALSAAHVRAMGKKVLDSGYTSSTGRRVQTVLIKLLKDAQEDGHTVAPSALAVSPMPQQKSDRGAIPLDHALAILDTALQRTDASRWVAAMLQALRPAEALGLTWDAIDFEAEQIDISWQLKPIPYNVAFDFDSGFRVPQGHESRQLVGRMHLVRPKSESGYRVIPLVPWMKTALESWKLVAPESPHNLVWPQLDGSPMDDKEDRKMWRELCTTAGALKIVNGEPRPYDLYEARHTAATLLKRAGVDDTTIIAIMGHASILSTKAYLHTDVERTRAALQLVAEQLQLGG